MKIKLSDYGNNILKIEISSNYNMACPHPLRKDKETELDPESIKKILNQIDLKDLNFKYI